MGCSTSWFASIFIAHYEHSERETNIRDGEWIIMNKESKITMWNHPSHFFVGGGRVQFHYDNGPPPLPIVGGGLLSGRRGDYCWRMPIRCLFHRKSERFLNSAEAHREPPGMVKTLNTNRLPYLVLSFSSDSLRKTKKLFKNNQKTIIVQCCKTNNSLLRLFSGAVNNWFH
jgi:hypothetical protein